MRRTQFERSTSTKTRLLEATVECLNTLGFAGTTTTEVADRAGVEAPRTVSPSSYGELESLLEHLRLPCLVKPAESYRYNRAFGVKMKRVHTPDELRTAWGEAHELGIGTMVQELIPGPETGGVNYNVYVVDGVILPKG